MPLDQAPFQAGLAIPLLAISPEGTIAGVNAGMAGALGRDAAALTGAALASLAIDAPGLAAFLGQAPGASGEFGFEAEAGQRRWLVLTIAQAFDDGAVLLSACDITESRERERRLQLTCERYLDMATAGSDTLHEIDGLDGIKGVVRVVRPRRPDGKLTLHEFERVWPDEIIDPSYDPDGLARYIDLVATRQPYKDVVHRLLTDDGREIYLRASAVPYFDEAGDFIGYRGISTNVTKQILAERALVQTQADLAQARDLAEQASQAKSDFLAQMSHEIRTPLNGVLGMAQAMAAEALPAVQRERLGVIQQSGEALLTILNDILDLAKIEAGKLELETVEFGLAQVVQGACSAFTAVAEAKGLALEVDLGGADGLYRGDPTRLRQIVSNLVSNALKFTETGAVRVNAALADGLLTIAVADKGIGMSAETLKGLFGRFAQADASTARRFGGTGLGLSICRQLAQMMGGTISARSNLGEGSIFELAVPLARIGKPARPAPRRRRAERPAEPLSLRVLAAEDSPINQLVLKTLLGQVGVEPTIVETGEQAVEAWAREPWDLILMDVQMPVMDGVAATRAIRAREAAEGRPRSLIIALSANAMSHQVSAYAAAGMDGHVAKPIAVDKLFAALETALEYRERGPDLAAVAAAS